MQLCARPTLRRGAELTALGEARNLPHTLSPTPHLISETDPQFRTQAASAQTAHHSPPTFPELRWAARAAFGHRTGTWSVLGDVLEARVHTAPCLLPGAPAEPAQDTSCWNSFPSSHLHCFNPNGDVLVQIVPESSPPHFLTHAQQPRAPTGCPTTSGWRSHRCAACTAPRQRPLGPP